nr:DUF3298 and DUF4163 domain-containing protein [uncultured Cellulosilyticum sp.]
MKKRIWAWAFAAAMLGGSLSVQAQAVTTDNTNNTETTKVETTNQEKQAVQVTFKKLGGEIRDGRKGSLLVKIRGNYPILTASSENAAVNKINDYYKAQVEAVNKQKEVAYEAAKEYYNKEVYKSDEGDPNSWKGYELNNTYTLAHQGDKVISFIKLDSSYTGDETTGPKRSIENFDLNTGELLTFKDIVTDETKAQQYIHDYIVDEIKDAVDDDKGYLYYGYKDHVEECLAEGNWYLSDSGIVVLMNEYVFTPQAEGTKTFYIPLSTFPYLKEAYK